MTYHPKIDGKFVLSGKTIPTYHEEIVYLVITHFQLKCYLKHFNINFVFLKTFRIFENRVKYSNLF